MRHKSMGKDRCIGSLMFGRRFKGLVGKFVCKFFSFFFSCRSIQNRFSVTLKGPRAFIVVGLQPLYFSAQSAKNAKIVSEKREGS